MTSIGRAMPSSPFNILAHASADNGRMRPLGPLLSLGLALLLFFAAALGSFHNHHDLADHPDCAVCAASHQADAAAVGLPLPALSPAAPPVLFALLVLTVPLFRPASLLRSRAPPR
jgi:hypothetical protein